MRIVVNLLLLHTRSAVRLMLMNISHVQISLVGLSQNNLALRCRPKPQLCLVCPQNEGSDQSGTVQKGINLINASIFTALTEG